MCVSVPWSVCVCVRERESYVVSVLANLHADKLVPK